MKVETLANQNVPNGTSSEVTLFKDVSKDIICFKNKDGVIIPLGGGGMVYEGLTATGTSQATTKTTLNYGINVFTTITPTNFCARLPIANTGQVVTVVNNTSSALSLHPSMAGGSINNTVNGIATVPPDGKAYSFYCIKNPLPGAWTWSPPAVAQFESEEITRLERVCSRALDYFGIEMQLDLAQEECAELIVAISHYRRNRVDPNRVAEEIADVIIMTEQLRQVFANEVEAALSCKLLRLESRIEK